MTTPKTPPLTREDIQRMRELEEKATPGPWDGSFMEPSGSVCVVAGEPPKKDPGLLRWRADWLAEFDWQDGDVETANVNEANARLTAALRTNAKALLDAAEERDHLAERVRELEHLVLVGLRLHEDDCTDESDCSFTKHAREALKGKTP